MNNDWIKYVVWQLDNDDLFGTFDSAEDAHDYAVERMLLKEDQFKVWCIQLV